MKWRAKTSRPLLLAAALVLAGCGGSSRLAVVTEAVLNSTPTKEGALGTAAVTPAPLVTEWHWAFLDWRRVVAFTPDGEVNTVLEFEGHKSEPLVLLRLSDYQGLALTWNEDESRPMVWILTPRESEQVRLPAVGASTSPQLLGYNGRYTVIAANNAPFSRRS